MLNLLSPLLFWCIFIFLWLLCSAQESRWYFLLFGVSILGFSVFSIASSPVPRFLGVLLNVLPRFAACDRPVPPLRNIRPVSILCIVGVGKGAPNPTRTVHTCFQTNTCQWPHEYARVQPPKQAGLFSTFLGSISLHLCITENLQCPDHGKELTARVGV